jgi:NADH-quinone oxidoreductase subunit E
MAIAICHRLSAICQPEAKLLAEKYRSEIEALLAKYPPEQKRSAVMPLLYLAQKEYGHITEAAMAEVGAICGMSSTQVAGIVGFYTLYHDCRAGKRYVQVCTDLPCALRGGEKFAEELCKKLGVRMGETTKDGEFTLEEVTCLAGCDRAPMFQVQDADGIHYHESESPDRPMTVEQAMAILESYKGRK